MEGCASHLGTAAPTGAGQSHAGLPVACALPLGCPVLPGLESGRSQLEAALEQDSYAAQGQAVRRRDAWGKPGVLLQLSPLPLRVHSRPSCARLSGSCSWLASNLQSTNKGLPGGASGLSPVSDQPLSLSFLARYKWGAIPHAVSAKLPRTPPRELQHCPSHALPVAGKQQEPLLFSRGQQRPLRTDGLAGELSVGVGVGG